MKRRIFQVLFISVFASMLGFGLIEPLIPIYAESLGASGLWIGIIFASFMISRALFSPLIGRMSDKAGRRKFILAGLLSYTILSVAYLFAQSAPALAAARFLQGITSALVVSVSMAYIAEISPHGEEGRYLSIFNLALFLGMATGPIIGGTISHYSSISYAFLSMGALSLFAFFLVLKTLPELQHDGERPEPIHYREILKDPTVRAVTIFRAANAVGVSGFMAFFPLFAAGLGINTMGIGLLVSVNLLMLSLFQPYFGKMADLHDKVRMVTLGTAVFSLSLVLMGLSKSFTALFAVNLLMGIGGAVSMPAATILVVKAGKTMGMGTVLGIFNTAMSIGQATGPILVGALYGRMLTGHIFILIGAMNLLASLVFYRGTRGYGAKLGSA